MGSDLELRKMWTIGESWSSCCHPVPQSRRNTWTQLDKRAGTRVVYKGVDRRSEGAMNTDAIRRSELTALARDPLVRLVMASDGVTEAELVDVLRTAQRAVAARAVTSRACDAAPRRRRLRVVPTKARSCVLV
jgi:hypothetical protein